MSAIPRLSRASTSPVGDGTPKSVGRADAEQDVNLPRTRAGTTWVLACVAAVVLLALIVFITQNLHPVEVSFLGWNGRFPLVVMVLAAAFIGCVSTLILGSTRILQLRRTAMSARRARARTRMPDAPARKSGPGPSVP